MLLDQENANISAFLNSRETAEINRLKQDDAVIGYVLMSPDGEELESSGLPDGASAVFANVFDMANDLGEELGEADVQPLTILESDTAEIFCINFSSARAVVMRRKPLKGGGLRSVD